MLITNYDQSKHFTNVLVEAIKANYPQLHFSIFPEKISKGKIVVWDSDIGYYEHIVPSLEKEEIFLLIKKIRESM